MIRDHRSVAAALLAGVARPNRALLVCSLVATTGDNAGMPIQFVETERCLSGIAFFAAASSFGSVPVRSRNDGCFLECGHSLLRVLALPLEPGDDLLALPMGRKIQNAGFQSLSPCA
jgi:hypothetical protein